MRACRTHLGVDEGLEGCTGGEEDASGGVGDAVLKDCSRACRVEREIGGAGGRELAACRALSWASRVSTFFLVVREVAEVPAVLMVWIVPIEALEAMVSPELLMVETSSWAVMRTSRSS